MKHRLMLSLLCVVACTSKQPDTPRPTTPVVSQESPPAWIQKIEPTPAPVEPLPELLGARQIAAAYDANEVAADDRFKGKRVRIVGHVNKITKSITGKMMVGLGRERGRHVLANFPEGSKDPATLKKGELVLTECVGAGMGLINSVHFAECKIVNPPEVAPLYPTQLKRGKDGYDLLGALKAENSD